MASRWQTVARHTIRMIHRRGYHLDIPASLAMGSSLGAATLLMGHLPGPSLARPAGTRIALSFLIDSKPSVSDVNVWVARVVERGAHVAVLVTELMPQAPAARELTRLVREAHIHLQLIDAKSMLIDCTAHADVPEYTVLTPDEAQQLAVRLKIDSLDRLWHMSPEDPQAVYWHYPVGTVLSFLERLDSSLEGTRCFRVVVDAHPPG